MACTITIQNVVDWVRTQAKTIPIIGVAGYSHEPALTLANNVIQMMLMGGVDVVGNPVGPFPWKFNRKEATSFDTTENAQDYTATVSDLGWLESCEIEQKESTSVPKPRGSIEVVRSLPKISDKGQPGAICWLPKSDTEITWRLDRPAGSTIWTVYPIYQKKPEIKTTLNATWSPIPDEYAFVFRQGFLALVKKHGQLGDWPLEYKLFLGMIAAALGHGDAEPQSQIFYPDRPILLG